jgi:hypothetical protein
LNENLKKRIKINLLALDNRPCSYKYFSYLCQSIKIDHPIFFSSNELFNYLQNRDKSLAYGDEFFIISIDNLLLGGIKESRELENFKDTEKIKDILNKLRHLVGRKLKNFYFYVSVPRLLMNYKDNIDYILKINHKLKKLFSNFIFELPKFYSSYIEKTDNKLERDLLTLRLKKLELLEYFLELFEDLNVLIVIDDSQFKGLNYLEVDYLKNKTKNKRVSFLVGLDEIHLIIFAKIFLELFNTDFLKSGFNKNKVIFFSSSEDFRFKYPAYEGTTINNIFKQYESFFNLKFKRVSNSDYFLNFFEFKKQREASSQMFKLFSFPEFWEYFIKEPIEERFLQRIGDLKLANSQIIFTDLSFANGANLQVLKYFLVNGLDNLKGFWAWNTFANTLGSSLAHFIISHSNNFDHHFNKKLVIENFLESIYQTIIRYFAKREGWDIKKIADSFQLFISYFNINVKLQDVVLPWNRYFEVDVRIKLD